MDRDFHQRATSLPGRVLTALLMLLPLAAFAETPPIAPFSHSFTLTSSGVPFAIKAERSLAKGAKGLWYMHVGADNWLGEISENTAFYWDSCTPQSSFYRYKRVGLGKERLAEMEFDQLEGEARVVRAGKRSRYAITPTTTDKLSQTLALQCMLSRGDMALELDIADERGLDHVVYRRMGNEVLRTPAGTFNTVKVERVREPGSDRKTLLWFAPEHDFALVQMVQHEDDKTHTLVINSLTD